MRELHTISELIDVLEKIKDDKGDVPVSWCDGEYEMLYSLNPKYSEIKDPVQPGADATVAGKNGYVNLCGDRVFKF